jgi:hypothetical protein
MLDEGGLVEAVGAPGDFAIFGHAVYALLVSAPASASSLTMRTARVLAPKGPGQGEETSGLDAALASALEEGAFRHPDELPRKGVWELVLERGGGMIS